MEQDLYQLPEGWKWEKLTDVTQFVGGSQPPKSEFSDTPKDGYVRLIQIRDYKSDAHIVYVGLGGDDLAYERGGLGAHELDDRRQQRETGREGSAARHCSSAFTLSRPALAHCSSRWPPGAPPRQSARTHQAWSCRG